MIGVSKDARVQQFLDDMRAINDGQFAILQAARAIVFTASPDITERFIYGGIMFTANTQDFGGVFVSKHHVSFEFTQGFLLLDPGGILEGGGKYRRHLKLCVLADITTKQAAGFVALALNQTQGS